MCSRPITPGLLSHQLITRSLLTSAKFASPIGPRQSRVPDRGRLLANNRPAGLVIGKLFAWRCVVVIDTDTIFFNWPLADVAPSVAWKGS